MSVFISYNRQSKVTVEALAHDLGALGHTVRFDQDLSGGQPWWDRILAMVRDCDLFVFALDLKALDSTACKRECDYAAALGKTILPVLVAEGVSANLLPPVLSRIQYVDYRKQDRDTAFLLARALTAAPPSKPLPHPLPAPPEVPLSYLGNLTVQIDTTSTLSLEQQSILVLDLKKALHAPETTDDARRLLERLRTRRDLLASIADEIDELLGSPRKTAAVAPGASRPEPPPREPAGTEKEPSETQSAQRPAAQPAPTPVLSKTPYRTRLVAALRGGGVGTALFMGYALIGGGSLSPGTVVNSLWWGFLPWAIAGAIAGQNRRVMAIALAVGGLGFVVGLLVGPGLLVLSSDSGVILGAIGGVIFHRLRNRGLRTN